jgi:hypothetical protein
MDANDGEHFAPSGATVVVFQGYKHLAPPEQRQVRQLYYCRLKGSRDPCQLPG